MPFRLTCCVISSCLQAADPFDGIVGMGYNPNQTVFRALTLNNKPAMFGLQLTPESVGSAELTLGGYDASKAVGELRFGSIINPSQTPTFWALESDFVAVNGHTSSTLQTILSQTPLGVIFDSGTSNCVFQQNVTEAIYALISSKIVPHGTLGAYGIPCSEIGSLQADITFSFNDTSGKPFNLTVPTKEFNLGPFHDDPNICQTLINAQAGFNILGGSLLKNYYSIWDVDHAQLGFAINAGNNITNVSSTGSSSSALSISANLGLLVSLLIFSICSL